MGSDLEFFVGGLGRGVQVFGRVVRVEPGQGFGARFTGDSSDLIRVLLRRPLGLLSSQRQSLVRFKQRS